MKEYLINFWNKRKKIIKITSIITFIVIFLVVGVFAYIDIKFHPMNYYANYGSGSFLYKHFFTQFFIIFLYLFLIAAIFIDIITLLIFLIFEQITKYFKRCFYFIKKKYIKIYK